MEIGKIRARYIVKSGSADMKKKHRGSSIQTQISLIKRAFEYAVDYDYVSKESIQTHYNRQE